MIHVLPNILNAGELAMVRELIPQVRFADGRMELAEFAVQARALSLNGTLNLDAPVDVKVSRAGKGTALAEIARVVGESVGIPTTGTIPLAAG